MSISTQKTCSFLTTLKSRDLNWVGQGDNGPLTFDQKQKSSFLSSPFGNNVPAFPIEPNQQTFGWTPTPPFCEKPHFVINLMPHLCGHLHCLKLVANNHKNLMTLSIWIAIIATTLLGLNTEGKAFVLQETPCFRLNQVFKLLLCLVSCLHANLFYLVPIFD